MSNIRLITLILLSVFLCQSLAIADSFASQKPPITQSSKGVSLAPFVTYFIDYDQRWSDQSIAAGYHNSAFIKNRRPLLALGYQTKPVWIKLNIEEVKAQTGIGSQQVFLTLQNPAIDKITLFSWTDGLRKLSLGDHMPFDDRPLLSTIPSFQLNLDTLRTTTVYLKIESKSSLVLPLYLGNIRTYSEHHQAQTFAQGITLALVFALFLVSAFISLRNFDLRVLGFSGFSLLFGIYLTSEFGLIAQYLQPRGNSLSDYGSAVSLFFTIGLLALTLRASLCLTKKALLHHELLFGIAVLAIVAGISILSINDVSTVNLIENYIAPLLLIFLLGVCGFDWFKGNKVALVFAVAISLWLIGLIDNALLQLGYVLLYQLSAEFTFLCYLVGTVILACGVFSRSKPVNIKQRPVETKKTSAKKARRIERSLLTASYRKIRRIAQKKNAFIGSYGSDVGSSYDDIQKNLESIKTQPLTTHQMEQILEAGKTLAEIRSITTQDATKKAQSARHSTEEISTSNPNENPSDKASESNKRSTKQSLVKKIKQKNRPTVTSAPTTKRQSNTTNEQASSKAKQLALLNDKTLASNTVDLLLVEPNDDRLRVIAAVCRRLGFKIHSADNGTAAFHLLLVEKIDCMIINCDGEDSDVFSSCQKILHMDRSSSLPIIGVTESSNIELSTQCMESGMRYLLEYPIKNSTLQSTLKRVLSENG